MSTNSRSMTAFSAETFFSRRRNMALMAVFYTFMWGCAFPLVKICMDSFQIAVTDHMSKCLLAGIRFTFSGILTLLCSGASGNSCGRVTKKQLKCAVLYGITATTLQYAFTYVGLSMIDGAKGAIYDQMGVFVIVLTSGIFFHGDRLSVMKLIGCVLGFAGVLVINADGCGFMFNPKDGIMMLAVICQTTSCFIAKGCAGMVPAAKLTGYGQLIGGAILCSISLLFGGRIRTINLCAVITLLLLIIISAVAYTLSMLPLRYFPVSEVSSFNLLITVFGVIMSATLLGENIFRAKYAVSLILISLGILLINRRNYHVEPIR